MSANPPNSPLLRTPLFEEHKKAGARIVPFAGYEMPVQYAKGLIHEHQTVRTKVGLFDVAHMGLLRVTGKDVLGFLDYALTRDLSKIVSGKAAYSLLCRSDGTTVDDLITYCVQLTSEGSAFDDFFIVLNAGNKDKDLSFLKKIARQNPLGKNLKFESLFDTWSILALQGPESANVLKNLGWNLDLPKPFTFLMDQKLGAHTCHLAFTGYTGEKGCEIFVPAKNAAALWLAILEAGIKFGIEPIGLGARDTLRTEMGYSLYGHELSDSINPIEAGLSWAVGLKKNSFLSRDALLKAAQTPKRKLICLKNNSKQAPRSEMEVRDSSQKNCGLVTSGTFAPSLGYAIGLALVKSESTPPYQVNIRGSWVDFEITDRPFLKK